MCEQNQGSIKEVGEGPKSHTSCLISGFYSHMPSRINKRMYVCVCECVYMCMYIIFIYTYTYKDKIMIWFGEWYREQEIGKET